jgi:hypothetical protein
MVVAFGGPQTWAKARGIKFDCGPIKIMVVGFGWAPKMGKSPRSKI